MSPNFSQFRLQSIAMQNQLRCILYLLCWVYFSHFKEHSRKFGRKVWNKTSKHIFAFPEIIFNYRSWDRVFLLWFNYIIGWCKMSAGLIGSFETKFNEILWLSQSNFLWEEVRKRVGHASSLSKICLCLCFFYMSLCLSFYLSLSLYICVFNFFCVQPNGINMQAPFQLVHESLFPGF